MLRIQKLTTSLFSLSLILSAFAIGTFSTQDAQAFDIKVRLTSKHSQTRHYHNKACYKIVPKRVYVGRGCYKIVYYRVPVCKKVVYRKPCYKKNYGHKKIVRKTYKKRTIRRRR